MSRVDEIAEGVFRLGTEWVNWYACEADGALVLVDSGFRRYEGQLQRLLDQLGRPPDAVAAIVLTHYHPDHAGAAAALSESTGAPVLAPGTDAEGLRRGKVPVPLGLITSAWRPAVARYLAHVVASGGAGRNRIPDVRPYADGDLLDLPVPLRAIATPGHTAGHAALLAEDRGVLFAGDAVANIDFFTRTEGVQAVPFNEDDEAALESLARLETVEADTVAFGHGPPLRATPADVVARARAGR